MEALQKSLTYRGDTGPYRKLKCDKDLCNPGTPQDDSKYVDLDDLLAMKAEGTKTVKVTFTGEGNQLAIIKCNSDGGREDKRPADCDRREPAAYIPTKDRKSNNGEHTGDVRPEKIAASKVSSETASSPDSPNGFWDSDEAPADKRDSVTELKPDSLPRNCNSKNVSFESEELYYTDMYLTRKSESEDGVSVVLTDNCTPISTEDESHYITTHEIQLLELDHDVDYDFGRGSCWDIEDDNLVYSFVDYASFDSDDTIEEAQALDRSLPKVTSNQEQSNNTTVLCGSKGAVVGTKREHDLCDLDKRASSSDIFTKNQKGSGNSIGQIHLSIKTTSRAINEQQSGQENENRNYCAKHDGDPTGYVFKNQNVKAEATCERARCFIPAPGRLHIGSKLKGKDITEYSSGASSSISELDDADKEVRSLTTRAFRSLACPYFDAINLSTSSESSASEYGLGVNRWSAFVDLKCGNVTQGREQNMISHKSSTSTFEMNNNSEGKGINALALPTQNSTQTKIFALNSSLPGPSSASSSTKKIELKSKSAEGQSGVITLMETLNFHCNVRAGVDDSERHVKFAENVARSRSIDEVVGTLPGEQGTEASQPPCETGEGTEDTHKKSIFASSLLKNVISKKMQLEQERKMERGEISDTYPMLSPSIPCKEQEIPREKIAAEETGDLQGQGSKFSEAGSGITIVSLDELGDIVDSNSCEVEDNRQREGSLTFSPEPNTEATNEKPVDTKKGSSEANRSTLLRSQNSAFRNWREGGVEFQKEQECNKTSARKPVSFTNAFGKANLDLKTGSNKPTKMSHLYVPSIQFPSKDKGLQKTDNHPTCQATKQGETRTTKLSTSSSAMMPKSPGIKISLCSVKEDKPNLFSIANLLTPNIVSNAASTVKSTGDSKCQTLVTSLKEDMMEKVPHFIVRDIRDNKGKLQPPIYHVRDVRKLVKSSYHFVSLDNHENKAAVAADSHVEPKTPGQGSIKSTASLSPIVIKCQSVNTNINAKQTENLSAISKRRLADDKPEAGTSPSLMPADSNKNRSVIFNRATGRHPLAATKQYKGDQKVTDASERISESKGANQAAIEKLKAAVKTMEQLYVFDRNEWKRKIQAPRPITDSHVLSLITSVEQVGTGKVDSGAELVNPNNCTVDGNEAFIRTNSHQNADQSPPTLPGAPTPEECPINEKKEVCKTLHIPFNREEKHLSKQTSHQSGLFSNKTAFPLCNKSRATAGNSSSANKVLTSQAQAGTIYPASKYAEAPLSLKISQPKRAAEDKEMPNAREGERPLPSQLSQATFSDSENYLTIPVNCHTKNLIPSPDRRGELTTMSTSTQSSTHAKLQDQSPAGHPNKANAKRHDYQSANKSVTSETQSPDSLTATIYHHSLPVEAQGAQSQVLCFSQPVPLAMETPSAEPFQQTQRKVLLDPTTGHYYLVDTPLHSTTRRLFDPETGQYVDVPMPQPSVTPVPMPVSPLALSPSTYSPAYVIYPGFVPSPAMMPAKTPPFQLSLEADSNMDTHGGQSRDTVFWESPYYSPTGWSTQGPSMPQFITSRGSQAPSDGKPIISITSQHGPRIIAPPCFDGTTMSFVVEHR